MPMLVGDRDKDAKQLEATSPLQQAARITRPLLMAYGGSDRRVPIEHGLALRSALRGHNPDVEWLDYPGEGHGFYLVENEVDFWQHVEVFLDKYLKRGS
jgi:dipeptidyl aminopeptidase/acylaminoacyl peptidase